MNWIITIATALFDSKELRIMAYKLVKRVVDDPETEWDDKALKILQHLLKLSDEDIK